MYCKYIKVVHVCRITRKQFDNAKTVRYADVLAWHLRRHVQIASQPLQKFATCNDIQGIGKTDPTQAFVVPSPIDVRVIEWILC